MVFERSVLSGKAFLMLSHNAMSAFLYAVLLALSQFVTASLTSLPGKPADTLAHFFAMWVINKRLNSVVVGLNWGQ